MFSPGKRSLPCLQLRLIGAGVVCEGQNTDILIHQWRIPRRTDKRRALSFMPEFFRIFVCLKPPSLWGKTVVNCYIVQSVTFLRVRLSINCLVEVAETERESWSFLFQRFFNVKTECLNVYNDFLDSSLAAYLPCLSTSRRTSSRILANSTTQFT